MYLHNILVMISILLIATLSFPNVTSGSGSGILLASSALITTTAFTGFNASVTSLGCGSALDTLMLLTCPVTLARMIVETDLPINPIFTESFTTTQNITLPLVTATTTTLLLTTVTMTVSEVNMSTTTGLCVAGAGDVLTPCTAVISATTPPKKSAAIHDFANPIGDVITSLKAGVRNIGFGSAHHNKRKNSLFRRVPNYCAVEALCFGLGILYILVSIITCGFYWRQLLYLHNEWIPNPVTVAIITCGMLGWAFIGYACTIVDRC